MKDSNDLPPPPAGRGESPSLTQAARCLHKTNRPYADGLSADDLARELSDLLYTDNDTETLLFAQAHLLDALFKRIVVHDMHGPYTDKHGTPHLRDEQINLALRSQKQSRVTLEALQRLRMKRDSKDEK